MRVLKAAWPVLCAFFCGYAVHDLLAPAEPPTASWTATAIVRWLVPVVLGLSAIEGVWRSLRTGPGPKPPT